jgi:hypothetical protein
MVDYRRRTEEAQNNGEQSRQRRPLFLVLGVAGKQALDRIDPGKGGIFIDARRFY